MDRGKVKRIAERTEATTTVVGGVLRAALRVLLTVLLVGLITALLFGCIFAYYIKTELSDQLKIRLEDASISLSSTIWYTDAEGVPRELQMLRARKNRVWVDYENLPKGMEKALVAIEDRRFYEHRGVDWYRTAGAFAQMFLSMSNDFGGSTLTQQLIKNNTENDADLVSRKLLEIFQALELEKTYDKQEIIEWYLNTVYFGEGCYGVYTAAQTYFGKDVWNLSLAESASIIGITNNPSKYDPFIANVITDSGLGLTLTCREWNKYRQELILREMYDQGYVSFEEYQDAVNEPLNFVLPVNEVRTETINSFYVEMVIDDVIRDLKAKYGYNDEAAERRLYQGGLQIYCCLDPQIQAIVDSVYQDVEHLPKSTNPTSQQLQSGMIIQDPYSGNIVAVGGAVGEKTVNDAWNYATDSKRQVGSSIKPLSVYGPALEYGLITQTTLVQDSAFLHLSGTNWYPRNSPDRYAGIITIRQALRDSKNTVAAQIVDKLTPQESYNYLTEKLGFTSLLESDADYAPMAAGALTVGATVREMTQAYSSFPNSGVMTFGRTYTKVLDSDGNVVLDNPTTRQTAFSPNTAANICDMLTNAVNYGTGVGAGWPGMTVAGKTGTTAENNDRYFVGFTGYYVAAVWTGYDRPETMYFGGTNPAVTIFHNVMQRVHAGLSDRTFPTPEIGTPTNIFGNLWGALQQQNNPQPRPTQAPVVTETPAEPTGQLPDTAQPPATQAPVQTPDPTPDPTPAPTPAPTPPPPPPPTEDPQSRTKQ